MIKKQRERVETVEEEGVSAHSALAGQGRARIWGPDAFTGLVRIRFSNGRKEVTPTCAEDTASSQR